MLKGITESQSAMLTTDPSTKRKLSNSLTTPLGGTVTAVTQSYSFAFALYIQDIAIC